MTKIICGVDAHKDVLEACVWPGGARGRFANTPEGVMELFVFATGAKADLVAVEASGGLEALVHGMVSAEGLGCAVLNAARVRDYARAMGWFEKTDRLDAEMIARFAAAAEARPTPATTPAKERLKALVVRLRQVTGDLVVQKLRRHSARHPEALRSLQEVIAFLELQSKRLAGEIASLIDDDPTWSHLSSALRSVKGVAHRAAAYLLAELPEIGTCSNKAISKLAGLAPLADDSGRRTGRRAVRGGRAGVRSILFLVAGIARKFDPRLAEFHRRLSEAGKPKMVVRIALAHKLLVWLNAKARQARAELECTT